MLYTLYYLKPRLHVLLKSGFESGLTLSACKRIKWITLVYVPNPDSIRVQPTSGGGLLNPDLD